MEKAVTIANETARCLLKNFSPQKYQGLSSTRAEIIARGYSYPIRSMNEEQAESNIEAILKLCGVSYLGIKQDTNNGIAIGESIGFVLSKFPMLGIEEIREAFELASIGYFEGVELKAYFGAFTISLLGAVLSAYLKYRNGIVAEMLNASEMAEKEAKKAIEAEEKNKAARAYAIQVINEALEMAKDGFQKWESAKEIPSNYSDIALKNGLINPSKEQKLQIWIDAQAEAKKEFIDIAMNPNDIKSSREAKMILAKLNKGEQDIKFKDAAVRIYSRLILWEFVKVDENKTP